MENSLIVLATEFLPNSGQHRVQAQKNDGLIDAFEQVKLWNAQHPKETPRILSLKIAGKLRPISAIFTTTKDGVEIVKKDTDSKDGLTPVGTPLMNIFTKSDFGDISWQVS